MGKWTGLRGQVPPAPIDESWQQQVNLKKTEFLQTLPQTSDKGREFCRLRDEKDALEEKVKKINVELEALSQLMVSEMETDRIDMLRLSSGDSLSIKDEPYASVEDKSKFISWIKESGQEDLLSVHYQTMLAMVKDRLVSGGQPPPGLKLFIKQSITRYRPRN